MKILKKILILILIIIIAIGSIFGVKGYNMYKEAITKQSIEGMVNEIHSKEHYTKIEDLPQTYLDAVVAVEDRRFYRHCGIDLISIGRAIFNDIRSMKLVEGGSTITQQLAKNIYFTQEKKFERKIAEVFIAFEIEKRYNKNEILELYRENVQKFLWLENMKIIVQKTKYWNYM